MREVSPAVLNKLDLGASAKAEALHWRNLIPPEPWAECVAKSPGKFARWVGNRLRAGLRNAPGHVVDARKAHQAFRPVPIVGIAERIALRALTDRILDGVELSERSPNDYQSFVAGPINVAFPGGIARRLSQAAVEYVVQADISSCYQYIDHGVLLGELESRTGKVEESRLLIELLGEIQGASYGLPQLLDPSDRLSELYLGIMERDATRRVGRVWRFNDDFRLAVDGYGNAQQALEDLSAAARPLGFVLNDHKSTILKFGTYYRRYAAGDVGKSDIEVNPTEIEILWVNEYTEADGEGQVTAAESVLTSWNLLSRPGGLKDAGPDDVRYLRHAFSILTKEGSPSGLPYVQPVFEFLPQMTPRLCEYLVAVHGAHDIRAVWSDLAARASVHNAWQRAWLTSVARRCSLLDATGLEWTRDQSRNAPSGLLHAEAALALATAGVGEFADLDSWLRVQPEALVPWYALAIDKTDMTAAQRNALRGSSPLFELLIDK